MSEPPVPETAVYGSAWNSAMRFMMDAVDEVTARHRFEAGEYFAVSVGRGLHSGAEQSRAAARAGHTPAVPEFTVEVNTGTGSFSTHFYDDYGSVVAIYKFRRLEEHRLFASQVYFYDYPDEPGYHPQNRWTRLTRIAYRPDGTAHEEVDDRARPGLAVTDRRDVALDRHWEPYPAFGAWESLGRADRRRPPLTGYGSPGGW